MATNNNSRRNLKPSMPLKTRLSISLLSLVTYSAQRSDGSVNRRLMRLFDYRTAPNPQPVRSVSSSDFVVDPSRNLWFRLFSPHVSAAHHPLPVVVFFHGGGFVFLSASSFYYDLVCRRIAGKLPAYVVSVDYRLAPEHRIPAQYDDGFDVLRFLEENRDKVLPPNADISKCFLAGDSAGGNIAHHVAVRTAQIGFGTLKLIGLISIQPFFCGEERTEAENQLIGMPIISVGRTDWCWKAALPEGSDRDHEAANVTGPNRVDISGLDYPDTLVILAGFDPLQGRQREYYEWVRKSGKTITLIEYPNMFHAFYIFPELPESGQLMMQIKDFVAKRVASHSVG